MTAIATWNDTVIATSDETIIVENNHYFPKDSIAAEHFVASETHSHCPWKGDASYFSVLVDGEENTDAAWYYPRPLPAAEEIRDYVAFWHGVVVSTEPGDGTPGPTPPGR